MADDPMFAPLAAGKSASAVGSAGAAKPVPIAPVPDDAPPCRWRHPKHGEPIAGWEYHDAKGQRVAYAARVEYVAEDGSRQKDVLPITYCRLGNGRCGWRARALPAPRPLYRLPELIANPSVPVIICEGEKKADAVPMLFPGWLGTTSMGGAGAAKLTDWSPLAGRNVIIWPDHDEPGRRYADDAAALATTASAASVAIVQVPHEWPEGWDIADPLPEGVTPDALAELLQSAAQWTSPEPDRAAEVRGITDMAANAAPDYQSEVIRLASLPTHEYDRCRKPEAQRLGVRVGTLDRDVERTRGPGNAAGDTSGQDRSLSLADVEPWPDPVDGAALLFAQAQTIRRYVVLDQAAADAAALWAVHTHAIDAAYVSPRLAITSPEKRCGKTTLLTVLGALAARPVATANMTTATIFRVTQAVGPTLLIDEADSFLGGAEEMRGVINAGHCRANATVLRTVETPRSPDGYEVRPFKVWGAMAIAAIGRLPGTIEDRSIKIAMRRRRPDEPVERLRLDRLDELKPIARRAARWAADRLEALRPADPDIPAELHDRAADNWRALLAIADAAGGDWPARARSAAVALTRDGADDAGTVRTMLLADIRAAFIAKAVDRLASEELVAYLGGLDDRPWPDYRAGKPITKAQVARLLKPLHVSSGTIRLPDGHTAKGYYRSAFDDAFARYLPAENVTTSQPEDFRGFAPDFKTSQGNGCGVSELAETPSISTACDGVTFREPRPQRDEHEFDERAGIREYLGGYPRAEAERLAHAEIGDAEHRH